ncbi:MAG: hypothetical protein RH945_12035 [Hyphomonas sp.]
MNKVFATIFLSLFATLLPAAFAQNDGNVVRVCNKGNVEIKYTRFLTKSGFFSGDVARVSGWYPIKAGRCHDINPDGYQTVAVGFLQTNDKGITGNPVYTVSGASRMGRSDWAPDVICVPIEKAVVYEGGLGIVREKFLPPCRAGQAALKMSFAVMPNDVFPEIKLKPQRNDHLIPWTSDAPQTVGGQSGQTGAQDQSTDLETAAKIILGAAQGLEDGKVRKVSPVCQRDLAFLFAFSSQSPKQACDCIGREIVRSETGERMSRVLSALEAGGDMDDIADIISEPRLERHMETCIEPAPAAEPSATMIKQSFQEYVSEIEVLKQAVKAQGNCAFLSQTRKRTDTFHQKVLTGPPARSTDPDIINTKDSVLNVIVALRAALDQQARANACQ